MLRLHLPFLSCRKNGTYQHFSKNKSDKYIESLLSLCTLKILYLFKAWPTLHAMGLEFHSLIMTMTLIFPPFWRTIYMYLLSNLFWQHSHPIIGQNILIGVVQNSLLSIDIVMMSVHFSPTRHSYLSSLKMPDFISILKMQCM